MKKTVHALDLADTVIGVYASSPLDISRASDGQVCHIHEGLEVVYDKAQILAPPRISP
jgi:hypothetical protein